MKLTDITMSLLLSFTCLLLGPTSAYICKVLDATKEDIYPDLNVAGKSVAHIMDEKEATEDVVFTVTQVKVTALNWNGVSVFKGATAKLVFELSGSDGSTKTWEF